MHMALIIFLLDVGFCFKDLVGELLLLLAPRSGHLLCPLMHTEHYNILLYNTLKEVSSGIIICNAFR